MPAKLRPAGYTLLEVLTVVVIVSILAGGALPLFLRNTQVLLLRDAIRRTGDLCHFAQSLAIFEGKTFRLVPDAARGAFFLTCEKDPATAPGRFEPYRAGELSTVRLARGVSLRKVEVRAEADELALETPETPERRQNYVEFRRDGTADEAVVVLAGEDGAAQSLVIAPLTGRQRVVDGVVELSEPGQP